MEPVVTASVPALAPLRSPTLRALDVRLSRVRMHLDGRRAKYVLNVENRSPLTADTYTYASGDGSAEALPAIAVAIPAQASLRVTFFLAVPRGRPARAITEVHVGGGTVVVRESASPRRRWTWSLFPLAVFAAIALFVASGAARPNVTSLAAPSDVLASRPFQVDYALSRARGAAYRVVSASGVEAASGTLAADAGSFVVALPPETSRQTYDIEVTARSLFGNSARDVRVTAEADPKPVVVATRRPVPVSRPRAAPAFTVDRLSLGESTVGGGKPVMVYYRVSSADGMVRLIDQFGTVRAEALLDRRGNSILLAPYVEEDQDFRVVLHASHGTAQAERSVPLRVTRARSLDDVLAAARRHKTGPIALVEQTVAPGEPIQIGIVQHEPGMRVALVDPQGQEVAASDVTSDQNEVTLSAPAVGGPAHYTVTATFKNGVSEETVIRNVTIGTAGATPVR